MSIFVDWGDADETLWISRFSSQWTANDFLTALDVTQKTLVDKTHAVDILADIRHSQITPKNLIALLRAGIQFAYEHHGFIVVITENDFWKQMHNLITYTFFGSKPTGIHFVKTVDDAYYFLDITYEERQHTKPTK